MSEYAVLLMAYGGPNSLEDIEPYLLDVRGGRKTPPELVEEVRERYALIGGRSPLLDITNAQAKALEHELNQHNQKRFRVYVGMRHWQPTIQEAVDRIFLDGMSRGVAICMTPYYSKMSVGAYFARMDEAIESLDTANTDGLSFKKVESWNDQPLFIEAISERVKDALKLFPAEVRDSAPVLFSAHSLPSALMEQGDPYVEELKETCRLVADQLGLPDERWQLCFQSAGAMNGRWLGPDLEDVIEELAEQGHKNMLAAPIGFVSDHVEILYDIDIEACQGAEARGVRLVRTQSMNTHPTFIRGLAEIVLNAIAAEPST